jgi:hypothetical protein
MRTSYLLVAMLTVATGAACGEVSGFIDAAPGDDDTIDASTVDAEPELGAVNVITRARCCTPPAGPLGGIAIFVVHPDGTLGDTATTDGNGEATVDVVPGSSVTAVYERDPGASLTTYAGVEPGDTITFGSDTFVDSSTQTQIATVTINWPLQVGINYFYVAGACGTYYVNGTSTTYNEAIYNTCPAGPTTYYLLAFDSNGIIVRYGEVPNVPHTTGTVSVPSFQATSNYTFNATGIPPEIDYTYMTADGYLNDRYLGGYGLSQTPTNGNASLTVGLPTSEVDSVITTIQFDRPGNFSAQYHTERTAGATPRNYANPRMLPWLSQLIVSIVTGELLWLEAGDEPYDATLVQLYWSRGSGGSAAVWGGVGSEYYDWTLLLPPNTRHVVLPPAPASVQPYLPTIDDDVDVYVQLSDSAGIDSYRDVVALPEWQIYNLGPYGMTWPLFRQSNVYGDSSGGGGKVRLLPRHGLPNQLQPPRHR